MSNSFDLTVNALRAQGLDDHEILEELSKLFRKFAETNKQTDCTMTEEEKIIRFLKQIGLPIHMKGFEYWVKAIIVYKETGELCMSKIYQNVAVLCENAPKRVEKTMRYAVEYMFKKCKKKDIAAILGSQTYANRKKLTK